MTTTSAPLLDLDTRKRITLGKLARFDRYTATVLDNGSIILDPAIVISPDEAAMLAHPEFAEMVRQRVADTKAGQGTRLDLETIRAELAELDTTDD